MKGKGWSVAAVAAVAAGLLVVACSSPAHHGAASSITTTSTVPTASTVVSTSTKPPSAGVPVNLVASDAIKADLVAAFIRFDGISAQDVLGAEPGSVYYAYVPSTGIYWALGRIEPSASAPTQVLVRFQDGANYAVFAQPSGSNWSVVDLIGEPACLQAAGLPSAVEQVWHLSDSSGCAPMSSTTKADVAAPYHVSFEVPADWTATPDQTGPFDEDGPRGFVNVDAASAGNTIQPTCQGIATGNALHPYGTAPTVSTAMIDSHPGCFITPSADAPPQTVRRSGPVFIDSSLVVRYQTLLNNMYNYLVITCDPAHLWSIAASIQFASGY